MNEEFLVGLSVPDKVTQPKLSPVDIHTKIDEKDPTSHILQLFPNLFEGIGTVENMQVHLNVDPKIEPVVQAPCKIPHSMLELLKAEIDRMLKLGVICKLHINEATDLAHNLVLVRKPSGKLHVCLNPHTINKVLRFNIHNAKTFPGITSKIKDLTNGL